MRSKNNIVKLSKNRIYIEPEAGLMPGVTHVGRLDFSSATGALEPHSHNGAVEFCYLERGIAVFQSGGHKWRLKGGECFVSYADEVHGTGSRPLDRMKLFWIGYKPELLTPWLAEGCTEQERLFFEQAIGSSLPRTFSGSKMMGAALNTVIDACLGGGSFKSIEIKTALLNLFLHLASKKSKKRIISYEIRQVIEYINKRVQEEISLNDCAGIAGISLSRFKTRFKTETGVPPGEFILRKKISKSADLLMNGKSVLETSIDCGFSSSQYFATVFKRYRNMSPTSWLKANLH